MLQYTLYLYCSTTSHVKLFLNVLPDTNYYHVYSCSTLLLAIYYSYRVWVTIKCYHYCCICYIYITNIKRSTLYAIWYITHITCSPQLNAKNTVLLLLRAAHKYIIYILLLSRIAHYYKLYITLITCSTLLKAIYYTFLMRTNTSNKLLLSRVAH